jgi:hypothetical protein
MAMAASSPIAPTPLFDEDRPDGSVRSALTLERGDWRMRNGHTARLEKLVTLHYEDPRTGAPKRYPIWRGMCLECATPMTWNVNGCYAAHGSHRSDIVAKKNPAG